jgi:DNA (cytosine-5)-methyltransferase 1
MAGFYEFFAGGGMVRAGLGARWRCLFANDIDAGKGRVYQRNWGAGEFRLGDIADLATGDLPGVPDLVWGSFPCQDLSLAGVGAGLGGKRSGTFFAFWSLVQALIAEGRAPRVVAIENVCGTLTSHGGADFAVICRSFAKAGYRFGALVIDAELFVPQSRPRLFVIGVRDDGAIPAGLTTTEPSALFHTRALIRAMAALPAETKDALVWWTLPAPRLRTRVFADLVEDHPRDIDWHSQAKTERLLSLMAPLNRRKVEAARQAGRRMVGAVYRRTRPDSDGRKTQRAEVRFDDLAGCLRTPAGGSSRQTILVVDGPRVRSRLISARETARLMGLEDRYILPPGYTDAYHLTGDGVVVPVVRHLAEHLFEPLTRNPAFHRDAA